jgi:CRP-like cAMP-binding protein
MDPRQLQSITVLRDVDLETLTRLAGALEERKYADGQLIFDEGVPGDSMYFLAEGAVRIEKKTDAAGTSRKTLSVLAAGDYFGEMALLEQKPRSGTAVAAGPTCLLRLRKAAFDELLGNNPQTAINVLFAMICTSSERIRRLNAAVIAYDQIGRAIGEARGLQHLLDTILQHLCLATLADWGLLLLKAQFAERLECRSLLNLPLTQAQKDMVEDARGFLAQPFRDRREHLVANIDEDEAFKSCPRLGFETVALLVEPIVLDDKLLGVVVLGARQPGHFDLNHLNLARGVARQAAQAILNARYREEDEARSRLARKFVRF